MKNIFGINFIEKKDLESLNNSIIRIDAKLSKLTKDMKEDIKLSKDRRGEFYDEFNYLKGEVSDRLRSDYFVVKTELKVLKRELDNIKKVISDV